ncbi:hypothetical protein BJ912DRAFT_410408 [Pholiota molesta]|nr:hypothetical protein BJ912DRAFT_410408 [Pholiota molesta]
MYPVASIAIPPDVFPLIASFIPLRAAPPTLRALALGNRRLHDIVRPLLYSRLILRTEDDAIAIFQKILRDPRLGLAVTELHVMSDLSDAAREGEMPFDVLAGIQMLVKKRLMPRLSALSIHLLKGWVCDEYGEPITVRGRLLDYFWSNLRDASPRLRTLVLQNVGCVSDDLWDRWLSGTAIDELNSILGLSTLRLEWSAGLDGLEADDSLKIYKNLPRLASSLHTLSLDGDYYQDVKLVLCHELPHLKRLSLQRFKSDDSDYVIAFLARHTQLEGLSLLDCPGHWLSCEFDESRFLPNLKHLKARFEDIRALLPVLPQLVSLSFTESYNCQVPYLLRELLPDGLPELQSLEIEQAVADPNNFLEGVRWYELVQGGFRTEKDKYRAARNFMTGYMHSVVRGAPGLQELGLHGMTLTSGSLQILAHTLSELDDMKRFYYRGFAPDPKDTGAALEEDDDGDGEGEAEALTEVGFLASAEALARKCMSLECVTSIGGRCLPYVAATIERDVDGEVTGVRRRDGVGMLIPAYEDDPFPYNT